MIAKLRGDRYWIHGTVAKKFFRFPLGTSNKEAAKITVEHIEQALAGGQTSSRWQELKKTLPPKTFDALAKIGNYSEPKPEPEAPPVPTWADLDSVFRTKMQQRIQLGKLAESTFERYEQTLRTFKAFLDEQGIHDLPAMKRPFVELTWGEVDFDAQEISRLALKRKKRVNLPIAKELLFALEAERDRRQPQSDERILPNPETKKPLRRPSLYRRMLAMGKRAGVPDSHPHRFRDTLACVCS